MTDENVIEISDEKYEEFLRSDVEQNTRWIADLHRQIADHNAEIRGLRRGRAEANLELIALREGWV